MKREARITGESLDHPQWPFLNAANLTIAPN